MNVPRTLLPGAVALAAGTLVAAGGIAVGLARGFDDAQRAAVPAGLDLPALWWLAVVVVLGTALGDALASLRRPRLRVSRTVSGQLPLGVPSAVGLVFASDDRHAHTLVFSDHFPVGFGAEGSSMRLVLAPGHTVRVGYRVIPQRRGEHRFGPVQLRIRSPLGFWWRQSAPEVETRVRVYPNFAPVAKYIRLGTDERLSRVGVRRLPRRGAGSEFQELRDYRRGDPMRQIDWRATARVRRLISREYQDERDQRVVFMLDCGRRMRSLDGELSHFDHSLNAVVLLAYMALRQGDSVAIGTFGNGPDARPRWMAPVKGAARVNRVLNALYDLEPSTAMPDYSRAASELLARHRKHALVVVVTDIRGEDVDDLLPALALLRRRHLVLVTSLRERALETALEADITSLASAVQVASAHAFSRERASAARALQQAGVLSLDVAPDRLSAELVNAYLALKASRAL